MLHQRPEMQTGSKSQGYALVTYNEYVASACFVMSP